MPARSGITCAWKRRPSPVSVTERGVRSNNRTPTLASRRATARLTPEGVKPSASAARAKLPVSVTAAKTPTPVKMRASKLMRETLTVIDDHHSIDLYALKSSLVPAYTHSNAGTAPNR